MATRDLKPRGTSTADRDTARVLIYETHLRQSRKMLQAMPAGSRSKAILMPRGTQSRAIHVDPELPAKAEAIRQHYLILDEAHQGAYASPKVSP